MSALEEDLSDMEEEDEEEEEEEDEEVCIYIVLPPFKLSWCFMLVVHLC